MRRFLFLLLVGVSMLLVLSACDATPEEVTRIVEVAGDTVTEIVTEIHSLCPQLEIF